MIVRKLCAFGQRRKFGNFQHFFHHNFRLKWKIWIMIVSSGIPSLDLSEYTLFSFYKKHFSIYNNQFFWWKGEVLGCFFFAFFSKNFQSSVILLITMIASENSYQNLSDYFKLCYQFENYALFGNVTISSSFSIITFEWKGNFKFWWNYDGFIGKIELNRKYLVDISESTLLWIFFF